MNLTKRIIKACNNNQEEKLNIILLHSNERYESALAKTGHNFFCPVFPNEKQWESHISKKPDNVFLLGENALNYQLLTALNPDIVIGQNRNKHWEVVKNICNVSHIPSILIERYPPPVSKEYNEQIEAIKSIAADVNVFDNVQCQKMWGLINATTIEDPIDKNLFVNSGVERTQDLMTVIHNNDENHRMKSIWDFINQDFPSIKCVGNFINVSSACESVEDLIKEYNKSKVYVNMNMTSSSAMREAMLCGCAVVTMSDQLNDLIEDGVNGYVCMDLSEMKQKIDILLSNKDLRENIANKGQESAIKRCSIDNFISSWGNIFNTIQKGIRQ